MYTTLRESYVQKFTGVVDSYYKFQLIKHNSTDVKYRIKKITKKGNCLLINNIFEFSKRLWVHKVCPPDIENYIGHVIGTSVGVVSWLPISFESTTFSYPYGIVRSKNDEDAIFFKVSDDCIFEVFVFAGKKYDTINYLQLLVSGHLECHIDNLKSRKHDNELLGQMP